MKKWIPIVVLVFLWGVICFKSYVGGTYLLGWDNLAPEFGFGINISRALSTAWQEYQGVGLLGGMGHGADVTRQIMLWITSFLVPTSLLRWGWALSMLLVGSLGIYALGVFLFRSSHGALIGTVFYLLNPVTVQVFNVPFETFTSFYGFVPWMIWGVLKYLSDGKRVDLFKLLIILMLGMSAFVVQTMFVVFVIMLSIFSLEYLITHREFIRVLRLWGVVIGVNLFWLLPVVWFGITSSSVNVNAKMNLLATQEVELMNVAYGKLDDVASLSGWWLQNTDVGEDEGMILLMQNWTDWLGKNDVQVVGIVIFVFACSGLLSLLIKGRGENLIWSWILLLLFILSMLARRVEILASIYNWISENVPLFGQMFRASYTKWSIPLTLVMSVGIMSIFGLLSKRTKAISWLMGIAIMVMTTYVVLPSFGEGIIGERMKVNLPSQYLNLFTYFGGAEIGRIAKLPANSLWGWNYNNWGYRGSGFLWYGVEQPILDRAFDVWSPYNEGFYNEFSNALYSCSSIPVIQCSSGVAKVLQKYDVRYVLLDESVIAPGQDEEILRIEQTKEIARELKWEKKFNEGFLTVWETPYGKADKFVSAPTQYTYVDGDTTKTRKDVIYDDVGSYVSGEQGVTYPFAGLLREEVKNVVWDQDGVKITSSEVELGNELVIPGWEVGEIVRVDFATSSATTLGTQWEPIPAYFVNGEPGPRFLGDERPKEGESYFYARVSEGEEWAEYRNSRKYLVPSEKIEIEVKGELFAYDFGRQGQGSIGNCDVLKRGRAEQNGATYLADERGAVCDYVVMEEQFTRVPHLMQIVGENIDGRSLKFFLYNTGSQRNDIEYLLEKGEYDQTFSLLSWDWDGHYSLNIETRSFGQYAENRVDKIEVRYAPIEKIARAKVIRSDQEVVSSENKLQITHVKKTGTWLYGLGVRGEGLIRLSQGYDEGWVGILVESEKLKVIKLNHVKVDGWSNGWIVKVDPPSPAASEGRGGWTNGWMVEGGEQNPHVVLIFYWPQLLQYLGFVLMLVVVLFIIIHRKSE